MGSARVPPWESTDNKKQQRREQDRVGSRPRERGPPGEVRERREQRAEAEQVHCSAVGGSRAHLRT